MLRKAQFLMLAILCASFAVLAGPWDTLIAEWRKKVKSIAAEKSDVEFVRRMATELGLTTPVRHGNLYIIGGGWFLRVATSEKEGRSWIFEGPRGEEVEVPKSPFARFLSQKKGVTKVAQKEPDLSAIVGTKKHLIVIDLKLGVVMRLKR